MKKYSNDKNTWHALNKNIANNMCKFKLFILLIAFILIISTLSKVAFAQTGELYNSGHIGLLTVSETKTNDTAKPIEHGGVADLQLDIKYGTGRIFIDSYPLSKLDTQITMRFASEIACDFLNIDCSKYDFFYTIRASSGIVGGPSAGAAATVLTAALLDNRVLDPKVVMTGTINSGNLVGPVAGIYAKTLAAQRNGFTKVLLPRWDLYNETFNDTTLDKITVDVISISTLDDALYYFTGINYSKTYAVSKPLPVYEDLMRNISIELCSKYGSYNAGVLHLPNLSAIIPQNSSKRLLINKISNNTKIDIQLNDSYNLTDSNSTSENSADKPLKKDNFELALDAINANEFYSAASFCFGGNVKITSYLMSNYSKADLKLEYIKTISQLDDLENNLSVWESKFTTISELETYMVVKERLTEAKRLLTDMILENVTSDDLAYAKERMNTAIVWSKFFALPGNKLVLNKDSLKIACNKKIDEVEERINYAELYLPKNYNREDIGLAYDYSANGEYALCIFTASKAKAEVDAVIGILFTSEDIIDKVVDEKLTAANNIIADQQSQGLFPILGYSYYEYAKTLKRSDAYLAMIYAEYSLELSSLDMYFPHAESSVKNEISKTFFKFDWVYLWIFALGFSIGLLVSVFFKVKVNSNKNNVADSRNVLHPKISASRKRRKK